MDYRVFRISTGEEDDGTEAHVFARAYRAAWRSIHGAEPEGRHHVIGLGLVFDFGVCAPPRAGTSQDVLGGRDDY